MKSTDQQPKIHNFMKLAEVIVIASADIEHAKNLAASCANNINPGIRINRYFFKDGSVMVWDSKENCVFAE